MGERDACDGSLSIADRQAEGAHWRGCGGWGRLGSGMTGRCGVIAFVDLIYGTKSPLCLPPSADQYLGRCETTHCRACSMGACGGNAARNFRTVGCASILSRHRQKAGYFGYMPCPSFVSPKPYVLGRM